MGLTIQSLEEQHVYLHRIFLQYRPMQNVWKRGESEAIIIKRKKEKKRKKKRKKNKKEKKKRNTNTIQLETTAEYEDVFDEIMWKEIGKNLKLK